MNLDVVTDEHLWVRDRIYLPPALEVFDGLQRVVGSCRSELQPHGRVFQSNLEGVVGAAAIPFTLTSQAATDQRFGLLHVAEKIRARSFPGQDPAVAKATANEIFRKEMATPDGIERMSDLVLAKLATALMAKEFSDGARNLLRQSTTLLWGAVEVLVYDLAGEFKLKTDDGIKNTIGRLFPTHADGKEALQKHELWSLFQRRHLIVHRCGVVDTKFLQEVGGSQQPGSVLVLGPKDLDRDLAATLAFGCQLLSAHN